MVGQPIDLQLATQQPHRNSDGGDRQIDQSLTASLFAMHFHTQ
jgi:hypothetical protein